VLVEAMHALDAKQAAAQAASDQALVKANAKALFSDPASWVGGNPKGDVTVVEFMDYRCPYCHEAYSQVSQLVGSDGHIRFIVKEYPILGPQSELSARFAIAVLQSAGAAAYGKIHDALMTYRGEFTRASLAAIAGKEGLDGKALLKAMNGAAVSKVIDDNLALGAKMAVAGTPTFVIADQVVRGYVPLRQMQQMVAAARKN
jgi:protein-disulfide isomerase